MMDYVRETMPQIGRTGLGPALTASRPATATTYAGLFVLCLANLMLEILLTRIFSVTMWYHFAFLAISVAMFGMTVGAVVVYLWPRVFTEALAHDQLALAALLFGVTIPLSFLAHLRIPFLPAMTVAGLASVLATYVVLTLPFLLCGVAVCIALTKFPRQVSALYAADLIGAASGSVLLIGLLRLTDGPTAVFVVALLVMVGAVLLALNASRRWILWGSLLGIAALAVPLVPHFLATDPQPLVRLTWVKSMEELPALAERWNSFSRIRVRGNPTQASVPFGWGINFQANPRLRQFGVRQLMLDIDATAGTVVTGFDGRLESVAHLKFDMVNLAHHLRPNSSVLVVGTGGGRDILSALVFKQPRIVGIEINGDIIDIINGRFGDFTGHLDRQPGVTFVNDDARSFVARQTDKFDLIQVSLIDTWAATAAGAFVLAENSLYTLEAWTSFLQHLTPRGIFSVSRWYFSGRPGEVYRSVSLASAALQQLGVANPRDHLVVVRGSFTPERGTGTILVAREPFTDDDLRALEQVGKLLGFEVVLTPRTTTDDALVTLASGGDKEAFLDSYPLNLRPPTDDTPFFFQMLRLRDIVRRGTVEQGETTFNMQAVVILGTILAVVFTLTVLCIVGPLLLARTRPPRGTALFFLYFGAIGLGFMLVEVSLMQRLIVFLGHPTYSLSVVLFSLLLAGGLGSAFTGNVHAEGSSRAIVLRLAALLIGLTVVGLALPSVVSTYESATTPVRIGIALGLLLPLGFLMGMAFPIGLKLAAARGEGLTAWLWGVNGAASVCGSVLAVAIALGSAISSSFWTGWGCYAIALAVVMWVVPRPLPGTK